MVRSQSNSTPKRADSATRGTLKLKTLFKSILLRRVVARRLPRDRPFDKSRVMTVLVLRFDRIGDMIVTTPFLKELKQLFNSAAIEVLSGHLNASVLNKNPDVSRALSWRPDAVGFLSLLMRRGKYDLIIDLNHSVIWRDLILIRLLNPIWAASCFKDGRYGVSGTTLPMYRLMPKTDCLWSKSITAKYLSLIEHLGGEPNRNYSYQLFYQGRPGHVFEAPPPSASNKPIAARRYWVVNQSGGRPSMCLEADHMKSMIDLFLRRDEQGHILWATSPDTYRQVWRCKLKWFPKEDRVHVYKPTKDPMDICMFLKRARGLVSPDTSLIHMANAFCVPTITVFADESDLFEQWCPPSKSWQSHLFSKDSKSLIGYDGQALMESVEQMIQYCTALGD